MFRYRFIDFSRGIAALIVAVVHWDGFMIDAHWTGYADGRLTPPLNDVLSPLYRYGDFAVMYFWMISGFIFAHVYGRTRLRFTDYAARRFARLYPLHAATLLLVAGLQALLVVLIGTNLFYPQHDLYHFFLNVTFMHSWGLEQGYSFNGPIWSVAVEIPIYILFWCVARSLTMNALYALGIAAIFFFLQRVMPFTHIDYCGMLFFTGVATFYLSRMFTPVMLLAAAVFSATTALAMIGLVPRAASSTTFVTVAAFGPLLWTLAALDRMFDKEGFGDRLASFGDLSYGIYLLHYPVLLIITVSMIALGIDRSLLSDALWPMLVYLIVTVGFAQLSFRWFEAPARRWLRQYMSNDLKPVHRSRKGHGKYRPFRRNGIVERRSPMFHRRIRRAHESFVSLEIGVGERETSASSFLP